MVMHSVFCVIALYVVILFFFFFCKTTRLVMDFLTTSKGMIGFLN